MRNDQIWHHRRGSVRCVPGNCNLLRIAKDMPVTARDQVVVVQVSVAGYAPNTPQGIKAQKAIDWNSTKV